jgi:hypothetical protein
MKRRIAVVSAALLLLGFLASSAGARPNRSADRFGPQHAAMVRYQRLHGYLPFGGPAAYERAVARRAALARRLHPAANRAPVGPSNPIANPSWQGIDEDDLAPPDTTGAIGPRSYIEFINNQMAIYDRTGALIDAAPAEAITGVDHLDMSDPQILYDVRTNRFYYLILDVNTDTMLYGFTKSNNPTAVSPSAFCNYDLDYGWGANLPDYPKMGTTTDFILIGVNLYANLATFLGSDVAWVTKPGLSRKPIATCPSASSFKMGKQTTLLNSDGVTFSSTPEPAVQTDPSSTGWIVSVPDSTNSGATGNTLVLYKVTKNPDGTANIEGVGTDVPVPQYSPPSPAPQMNSGHTVDTLDGRLIHAVSGNDPNHSGSVAVWTSHTVFGGPGAEVRWYEIDVANAATFQLGRATDAQLYVFNGGVSPDRLVKGKRRAKRFFGGTMVMGFTTSSPTTFPAIQMVSKIGSHPQSAFVMVKQSPGPDDGFDCFILQRCRWGDYAGATPDPAASSTASTGRVWLTNEWVNGQVDPVNATWRTWNWEATP